MLELAFGIGGKLESSFLRATGAAAKGFDDIQKKAQAASKAASGRELENRMKDLSSSAERVSKGFSKIGREIRTTFMQAAAPIVAATAALYGFSAASSQAGDVAIKSASKAGMSVEAYTELAYAAKMGDVEQEAFLGGMIKLNKTLADAAQGSKSAKLAFERAGVSIYDQAGKLKNADQIMMEASDTFKKMPEGPYKASLAMALFGKSGAALIPMLQDGSDVINQLREDAKKLGITFNEEDARAAQDFNDSLTNVKLSVVGLTYTVGKQLTPYLIEAHKAISGWVSSNQEFIKVKTAEYIKRFVAYLPQLKQKLSEVISTIQRAWGAVSGFVERMGGWEVVIKRIVQAWVAWRALNIVVAVGQTTGAIFGMVGALGKVIPLLIKLKALGIFSWLAKGASILTKGVGLLTRGIGLLVRGLIAAVPAIAKFTVALLANPITWVIAAVAALAAGLYVLYKRWDEVKSYFVNGVASVKAAFKVGFIDGIIELLKKFNPLTLVAKAINGIIEYFTGVDLISVVSDKIAQWTQAFKDWKPIPIIRGWIDGIINTIKSINLFEIGEQFIAKFGEGILNGLSAISEKITSGMKSLIPDFSWMAGPGSDAQFDISPGMTPAFANGGIVTHRQIAQVGEAGPEAIIPLNRPTRAADLLTRVASMVGSRASASAPQALEHSGSVSRAERAHPLMGQLSDLVGGKNGSTTISASFAPVVNVKADGSSNAATVKQAVSEALAEAQQNFQRMLDQAQYQAARVAMR